MDARAWTSAAAFTVIAYYKYSVLAQHYALKEVDRQQQQYYERKMQALAEVGCSFWYWYPGASFPAHGHYANRIMNLSNIFLIIIMKLRTKKEIGYEISRNADYIIR